MSYMEMPWSMETLVDYLHLERSPKAGDGISFNVKCPFCDDRAYHLNINVKKQNYNCPRCGTKGGMLDLFARLALNMSYNGSNGKEIFDEMERCMGTPNALLQGRHDREIKPEKQTLLMPIFPAEDEELDRVYSALLSIPILSLSEEHKANLLNRGMTEERIQECGYATMPQDWSVLPANSNYKDVYCTHCTKEKSKSNGAAQNGRQLAAGILLAKWLLDRGYELQGVPGFYQLEDDTWCLRVIPGMMIPTRNLCGQIVGIQIRLDKGDVRYMTLSAKGYKGAVTERIARVHFPLHNPPLQNVLSGRAKCLLTEGPLKSDVTVCLKPDLFMLAIPGVNSTTDLKKHLLILREKGVDTIYDALDMDKLVNPNVAKGAKALHSIADSAGVRMPIRYWAESDAKEKLLELQAVCMSNGLDPTPKGTNVFIQLRSIAERLNQAEIEHSVEIVNGKKEKRYWPDATKGIDDFCLNRIKKP